MKYAALALRALCAIALAHLPAIALPAGDAIKKGGAGPFYLARFENPADFGGWSVKPTLPTTIFELSKWPDAQPGTCAKVGYGKYEKGTERWPAVVLPGSNMPFTDWRIFESVSFDLFVDRLPAGGDRFYLHLRTRQGGRASFSDLGLKQGRQVVTVPLSNFGIEPVDVTEFHLVMTEPSQAHLFYVGELRLNPRGDLRRNIRTLRAGLDALEQKSKEIRSEILPPDLRKTCQELLAGLPARSHALSEATADPMDTPSLMQKQQLALSDGQALLDQLIPILRQAELRTAFPGASFGYGWANTMEKVYRGSYAYPGSIGGEGTIDVAQNEAEAVQGVLLPFENLRKVKVWVKPGSNEKGARLEAACLSVAPVGYVKTERPPYPVKRTGWHPDPILEYLAEIDLEAYQWQSYWVEVKVPKRQEAGVYSCAVEFESEGKPAVRIPLKIRVRNFSLPDGSRLPLALAFGGDRPIAQIYIKDPLQRKNFLDYAANLIPLSNVIGPEALLALEMRRKAQDLLLDHRLIPDGIYRAVPPSVEEVKYFRSRGARQFNLLHVPSQKQLKAGDPYPAEKKKSIMNALEKWVPIYEKAGLLDMAYLYGFDEIGANEFAAVKDIFGEIKKRYPRISLMTTAYDHTFGRDSGLDEVVDVWVPLTPKFEESANAREQARARGRHVWWYICCAPKAPYANWFIESPAAEHRLVMGLMPYRFQSEGFLYYCLAMWRTYVKDDSVADGWKQGYREQPMGGGPLTDWPGYSWRDFNGDGNVMYPGANGPIPSIRLKNIRDGLEDYHYLKMLEDAVKEVKAGRAATSVDWLGRAEACLRVNPELVSSLTAYSTDGKLLLAERSKIADLLDLAEKK